MKNKSNSYDNYEQYEQNIETADLSFYTREVMIKYGINICLFRAIPIIIDGLIPVERRTLYSMYENKVTPDRPRIKVEDLIGGVMKYHPHGGQSIGKSFENKIKVWDNNVLLYDVHGNCGSITGDRAASYRYLEACLSKYSMKCFFEEFLPDIVDMTENNTRNRFEPVWLPAKYPHCLVTSKMGIGWGFASYTPPYNVNEVFSLAIKLIENPDISDLYLYPDSPRGYDIIETKDIINICKRGDGNIKIQAKLNYVKSDEHGNRVILITGFPEKQYMDEIKRGISKLVLEGKINGIEKVEEQTTLEEAMLKVVLKDTADPQHVIDVLYDTSSLNLRTNCNINYNFAARTSMEPDVGLKDVLTIWLSYRIDYKYRYYVNRMSKLNADIHMMEGLMKVISTGNIDKLFQILKQSKNLEESTNFLQEKFGINALQAKYIHETSISKLIKSSQIDLKEKVSKLRGETNEIQSILMSNNKIENVIIEELAEGMDLFGRPRSCQVVSADVLKSSIHWFNVVVTSTHIKKMSINTPNIGSVDNNDEVVEFFKEVSDISNILLIDTVGRSYTIPISLIPVVEHSAKGIDVRSVVNLKGEIIKAITYEYSEEGMSDLGKHDIIMFTRSGIIKRSSLIQYVKSKRKSEIVGITLNGDDSLCYSMVHLKNSCKEDYTLIYTKLGFGISINLADISVTDRATKGFRYLKLNDNDVVKGCIQDENIKMLLIMTAFGYCKICGASDIFKTTKRKADMIRISSLDDNDYIYSIIPIKNYSKNLTLVCYMQSGKIMEVPFEDIPISTRIAKGKKLINTTTSRRTDTILKLEIKE